MAVELIDVFGGDEPDWSAGVVRQRLTEEEVRDYQYRLATFAASPEPLERSVYTTALFARDLRDVVAAVGQLVKPDQSEDRRENIEQPQLYTLLSPGLTPTSVYRFGLVHRHLGSLNYDRIWTVVPDSGEYVQMTFFESAFSQRFPFCDSGVEVPKLILVIRVGDGAIVLHQGGTDKFYQYDPYQLPPQVAKIVQAHLTIAAASLAAELDRQTAQDTLLLAGIVSGEDESVAPPQEG